MCHKLNYNHHIWIWGARRNVKDRTWRWVRKYASCNWVNPTLKCKSNVLKTFAQFEKNVLFKIYKIAVGLFKGIKKSPLKKAMWKIISKTELPVGWKIVFKSLIVPNKEGFQIRKADMQIWPQGDGWVTELKSYLLINHVKSLLCFLLDNQRIYTTGGASLRYCLPLRRPAGWRR